MAKHAKLTRIVLEVGTLCWHHKEHLNTMVFSEGQRGTVTMGQRDTHDV